MVTVMPAGITNESLQVGTLPHDQVVAASQLPLPTAVHIAAARKCPPETVPVLASALLISGATPLPDNLRGPSKFPSPAFQTVLPQISMRFELPPPPPPSILPPVCR